MSDAIEIPYPFVLEAFNNVDEEGHGFSDESWRPGTKRALAKGSTAWFECDHTIAQGMGTMIITPVSKHKPPGRYQERVFFTRRWRDPEGKEFGKNTLRVTTAAGFTRLLHGYRYSYKLEE